MTTEASHPRKNKRLKGQGLGIDAQLVKLGSMNNPSMPELLKSRTAKFGARVLEFRPTAHDDGGFRTLFRI